MTVQKYALAVVFALLSFGGVAEAEKGYKIDVVVLENQKIVAALCDGRACFAVCPDGTVIEAQENTMFGIDKSCNFAIVTPTGIQIVSNLEVVEEEFQEQFEEQFQEQFEEEEFQEQFEAFQEQFEEAFLEAFEEAFIIFQEGIEEIETVVEPLAAAAAEEEAAEEEAAEEEAAEEEAAAEVSPEAGDIEVTSEVALESGENPNNDEVGDVSGNN